MADPFEEFEFKPLTEGLGFHKKAEKIKTDVKPAATVTREAAAPARAKVAETPTHSSIFGGFDTPAAPSFKTAQPAAREITKTASQSISELMASLPPSLDFLDDKTDLARPNDSLRSSTLSFTSTTSPSSAPTAPLAGASAGLRDGIRDELDRPRIFQPLAPSLGSNPGVATGPTVGSVLPAPGTRAGGATAAATMPAPLVSPAASPYRDRMNEGFAKAFPQTEKSKATVAEAAAGLEPVAANFAAGLIDAMVVSGISTILLVCIITITRINLIAMLSNASTDGSTQLNLVLLFLAVLQIYLLVSRAFAGATLGEWAFDLQLGTNEQQKTLTYPLQVLWRSIVTTATGLFTLPLLSFAFQRDLGKYVTGLQLYRRL